MEKEISALQAKYEAQKIAFAPLIFQAVMALKKLGILELMGRHYEGISIAEIVRQTGISRYGASVLLEAVAGAGVVRYLDEHTVQLTKTGYMLYADRMTEVNLNFVNDVCYDGAKSLTGSIQSGKPVGLKTLGDWSTVYEGLSQLPDDVKESWFAFDHFYSDNAFPIALEIVFREKPATIFDIGGNTGKWSFACCDYNKDVHLKILDLPGQLALAKQNAEARGLLPRIDFYPIDLLDERQHIPAGADAIWMSQFLDCFSEQEIRAILTNVARASTPNTSIYILEPFIDNQTFEAASFCLTGTSLYFTCIANGNSKMYTLQAMTGLVQESGLEVVEIFPNIGTSYHSILKCKLS